MISPCKLLVVTNEPPWPATHGGRVDQWTRYVGLKSLGWSLALLTWSTPGLEPSQTDIATMKTVFDDVLVVPKPGGLPGAVRRLTHLPVRSTHVSSRLLSRALAARAQAFAGSFAPQAVMLDAIYGYEAARTIADRLAVPMLLRSHNIEHKYMRAQADAVRSLKSHLQLRMAALHLEAFEKKVHEQAVWTFDCSTDDQMYWRGQGIAHNSWVPPFCLASPVDAVPLADRPYDFVYMGNLNTPNNVEGLLWLFDEVLPKVMAEGMEPSVLVAGSRPVRAVETAVSRYRGARLIANPEDAAAVRRQGRVQLNPILRGSGINVKSIEMLFEDAEILTTPIGVQGMPAQVREAFTVLEGSDAFAGDMVRAMAQPRAIDDVRRKARAQFGEEGLWALSDHLRSLIESSAAPGRSAA